MADLSQDEIDALISGAMGDDDSAPGGGGHQEALDALAGVERGGMEQEEEEESDTSSSSSGVQRYDFRKPSPVPEEQKKTIALLHEQFAQRLKVNLSAFLRAEVEASLENVEQVTFAEYIASLNSPTCIASFDMQPLNGFGLLETNAIIAYSIIDRMLGGSGSVPSQVRPFTDVELAIIRQFIDNVLNDMQETWKSLVKISFSPKEIYTNPAIVRIIPQQELTLIITLNVKIVDASGLITICIPYSNLEPIAFKLSSQQWNKYTSKQSEDVKIAQRKNFLGMELELKAVLENVELTMEEILSLQVGDIIDLGKRTKDPISLLLAEKEKFLVYPGLLGKYKAVEIDKETKKE